MELRDVRSPALAGESLYEDVSGTEAIKPNSAYQSRSANPNQDLDAVTVDAKSVSDVTNMRARANEVISVINVASEASGEIGKLVDSVGGILEQAQADGLSDTRRSALEKEANQLVDEIKRQAQTSQAHGIKPLAGDSVRFEVEQRFGKALDIILPDGATDAFGIGEITFSPKESIIDTVAKVKRAQQQLVELQQSLGQAHQAVRDVVNLTEVQISNLEAAGSTVRDVDEALSLVQTTKTNIGTNHKAAIESLGGLNLQSLELLK